MNPADKAREMMANLNQTTKPSDLEIKDKFIVSLSVDSQPKVIPSSVPIERPLDNLINESRVRNQAIPFNGINIKPNTYERIRIILKDGGMDSSSQIKSIEKIKEVLEEK